MVVGVEGYNCYSWIKQQAQSMLKGMRDQWWVNRMVELQAATDMKDMNIVWENPGSVWEKMATILI